MDTNPITALFPVLLIWVIVIKAYVFAARRDGRVPADDIGVWWLVVLALYATLSPLSWLLQGGSYGLLNDSRLARLQPDPGEVVYLLNIALAYACGFAAVYLFRRRRVPRFVPAAHARISSAKMAAALVIVVIFQAAMLIVTADVLGATPESYIDAYRSVQELPLALRQLLKVGGGIASAATLVLLAAVLQRWPRQRLLFIGYLGIVLLSFDPEGSRAAVATGLFAVAIAWHVLVRPFSARWWLAGGLLGLVLFLALGFRRALGSWAGVGLLSAYGMGVGEFDSLWANAIELLRARESGGFGVPAAIRFGEFWSFVPSQLLPFEKMSLSNWFVQTFYPAYHEAGGGLAFGAFSQAVIGGGLAEAVLRGAILGALAVWLMKWYRKPRAAWWRLPVYLYLLVFVFQSVRDTTFRPLGDVVQIVFPAILLIGLGAKLFVTGGNSSRPAGAACRRSSI